MKVDITKSMIKSVNILYSRYQEALKESRKKRSEAEKKNTEKRLAQMKIKESNLSILYKNRKYFISLLAFFVIGICFGMV